MKISFTLLCGGMLGAGSGVKVGFRDSLKMVRMNFQAAFGV